MYPKGTNGSYHKASGEWHGSGSCDASCPCSRPTTVKLEGVVPRGKGEVQENLVVHKHNLTMRDENEGLTLGNDSPVMTDNKEGLANSSICNEKCLPVMAASSSDVVNSAIDNSEVVRSESVADHISKEVAQETERM